MNPLHKLQSDHNRATFQAWQQFAGHRARLTGLLRGLAGSSRLCVLGAGNSNDLDLAALASSHQQIDLVDLDGDALAAGVAQQGLTGTPGVRCFGGIDVTAMLDRMADWSPGSEIVPADLTNCIEAPVRELRTVLPGPYAMVASTCLLSQLILALVRTVGERHPRFVELVQAIRLGHLRLLDHLAAPGGSVVLITDMVSSDTFPPLAQIADDALPAVLTQLVRDRNLFHGVNPAILPSLYRTDPVLSARAATVELVRPWKWNLGPRTYAVYAVNVRIRPAS